jgi:hypothetical protein
MSRAHTASSLGDREGSGMPPGAMRSLDTRLYRAALLFCPTGFRREHGEEMARDFDEARGEAAACGDRALWVLRFLMGVDLARTVGIQWLRTGVPAIALAAMLVTLALVAGLALVARAATIPMPAAAVQDEVVGVLLLTVVTVVLIAMTIVLSLWASRPSRRGRW